MSEWNQQPGPPANQIFNSQHRTFSDQELWGYLNAKGMQVKAAANNEIVSRFCPWCPDHKGKSDNQWKLSFTRESGAFFCQRCGAKGSFYDLKRSLGDAPASYGGGVPGLPRAYKRPDQQKTQAYPSLLQMFPEVLYYLGGKEPGQRHLTAETIKKYRVGAAVYSFEHDPGQWVDHLCVTFPWFCWDDKGTEQVARVKARALDNKAHMRLDPAGGAWGWFGMHLVGPDVKEVVVTEGEYDAMAVHQATGLPAISLPNGARSLPPELIESLERFDKIWLWMDDDPAGQDGAFIFADKLGVARTHLVHTRDSGTDAKDANELLVKGGDLMKAILAARPRPNNNILSFRDVRSEVYRMVCDPDALRGLPFTSLPSLTKILKGWRPGELTLKTGKTGGGKTTIEAQQSLDLIEQGVPTLWGSFEIPTARLARTMLFQSAGERVTKENFDHHFERMEQMSCWFMRFQGSTPIDQVLAVMDYAVYVLDVRHVILDNLQFMVAEQADGLKYFILLNSIVAKIRAFASQRGCHVTLIIHPNKEAEKGPLHNGMIFGGGGSIQVADNIVMVQAFDPDARYLEVTKNRYGEGDLGRVYYRYNRETYRIEELTHQELAANQRERAFGPEPRGRKIIKPTWMDKRKDE